MSVRPKLNAFGEALKAARTKRQFTLGRLSEKADVSTSYLSELERGTRLPSAGVVCGLSRALAIDINVFARAVIASWAAKFREEIEVAW